MAVLTVQDASEGLANAAFGPAAAGGDSVVAGARAGGWDFGVALLVRNTDAAAKTVTLTDSAGNATPYVVPATTGLAVIPIRSSHGLAQNITYSAVLNVAVAAVRLAGD